jgi:hypothetical protein
MSRPQEQKPVHVVHCRECNGYHRIGIKVTTIGIEFAPDIPEEYWDKARAKLFRTEIRCPETKESFIAAEDDWLHLSEEEFHVRFPGNRRT